MRFNIIILFLGIITLFSLSYANSTGVISSDLNYLEDNLTLILGEISKVSENYYRFERFMKVNDTKNTSFKLIVPHDIKINTNKSYGILKINYFEDYKVITSNKNEEVLILYFSKKEQNMNPNYSFLILNIFIVFCILVIISNIYIIKYFKKKYQKIQIPSTVLSKEEKQLYDCIKSNEGKNQKEIGNILNWSKARVSALTNNLADKELIRKERFGRVYKLYITNNVIDG